MSFFRNLYSSQHLLIQALIPLLALGSAMLIPWKPVPIFWLAAGLAFSFSLLRRNPWWWHFLHAIFFPLVDFTWHQHYPPWIFLMGFLLTFLLFSGVLISRVPLYFTGKPQHQALLNFFPNQGGRCADLGAGIGSAVIPLAQAKPEWVFDAFEISPLIYGMGRIRSLRHPNIHWHFQRFETADLSDYDVVYVFLSPIPMSALWKKVCREMRAGSYLISNSFPVAEVAPDAVLLKETNHPLFIYRLPSKASTSSVSSQVH